jgi:hypothetical protein
VSAAPGGDGKDDVRRYPSLTSRRVIAIRRTFSVSSGQPPV